MLKTLVGAFKNKDIRKKTLYTLMILVIVRVVKFASYSRSRYRVFQ